MIGRFDYFVFCFVFDYYVGEFVIFFQIYSLGVCQQFDVAFFCQLEGFFYIVWCCLELFVVMNKGYFFCYICQKNGLVQCIVVIIGYYDLFVLVIFWIVDDVVYVMVFKLCQVVYGWFVGFKIVQFIGDIDYWCIDFSFLVGLQEERFVFQLFDSFCLFVQCKVRIERFDLFYEVVYQFLCQDVWIIWNIINRFFRVYFRKLFVWLW